MISTSSLAFPRRISLLLNNALGRSICKIKKTLLRTANMWLGRKPIHRGDAKTTLPGGWIMVLSGRPMTDFGSLWLLSKPSGCSTTLWRDGERRLTSGSIISILKTAIVSYPPLSKRSNERIRIAITASPNRMVVPSGFSPVYTRPGRWGK